MKTPILNSFWTSAAAPLDDLARIQEYIKPCDPSTLPGFLTPITPSLSSTEEEPRQPSSSDPALDELLETYGTTPEEFAISALNEPELWEAEELEKFFGVLSKDLPPQAIADIALEHMRTGGARAPKQKAPQLPAQSDDDELEELFPDRLEEPRHQMPGSFVDMSPIPGTISLDKWWEKKS